MARKDLRQAPAPRDRGGQARQGPIRPDPDRGAAGQIRIVARLKGGPHALGGGTGGAVERCRAGQVHVEAGRVLQLHPRREAPQGEGCAFVPATAGPPVETSVRCLDREMHDAWRTGRELSVPVGAAASGRQVGARCLRARSGPGTKGGGVVLPRGGDGRGSGRHRAPCSNTNKHLTARPPQTERILAANASRRATSRSDMKHLPSFLVLALATVLSSACREPAPLVAGAGEHVVELVLDQVP